MADEPETVRSRMSAPAVPEDVRRKARATGGGWYYEIVGSYSDNDAVPPSAIKGAWRLDADGNLTGEYRPNPNFKPP